MPDPGELDLSRGRLSQFPLAALLLAARQRRATGLLSIEAGGGVSRLFLRDGAPCFAQVAVGYRPLGQVLVQYSLVDLEAFDRALPQLEKGRPLTEVLLEAKAIDEDGLAEGLRMQLVEHVRALAALREGNYEFREQPLPAWASPVSLTAERSVAEALAAAEPLQLSLLAGVGANLLKLKDGCDALLGALPLEPGERAALEALRDGGGSEDLEARGLAPPRARWLASLLLALGGAEPFDPRPEARARAEEESRRRLEEARAQAEAAARAAEEQAQREAEAQRRRAGELKARLEEEARARETEQERRRAEEQARQAAEVQARLALEQAVADRARLREETEQLVQLALRRTEEEAARIRERQLAEATARGQAELDRARAEAAESEQALQKAREALEAEREALRKAEVERAAQQARLAEALAEAERIGTQAKEDAGQERSRVAAECRARIEQLEQAPGPSEAEQRLTLEAAELRAQAQGLRDELGRVEASLAAAQREKEELARQAEELVGRAAEAEARHEAARAEAASLVEAERTRALEQARAEEQEARAHAERVERERAEAEEVARRALEEARLTAERLAREVEERRQAEARALEERTEAEATRKEREARAAEAEERAQQQAQELAFARHAAANAAQELARKRALAAERLEREARELLSRGSERWGAGERGAAFAPPATEEALPLAASPTLSMEAPQSAQAPVPIPLTQEVPAEPLEVEDADIVAEGARAARALEAAAEPPVEAPAAQAHPEFEATAPADPRERAEARRRERRAQARRLASALQEVAPAPRIAVEPAPVPAPPPAATIDLGVEDIAEPTPEELSLTPVSLERPGANLAGEGAAPAPPAGAAGGGPADDGADWLVEPPPPLSPAPEPSKASSYDDVEFEPPPPITLGSGEVVAMPRAAAEVRPRRVEGAVVEGTGYLEQAMSLTSAVDMPEAPGLDDLFGPDPQEGARPESEIATALAALASQEPPAQDAALDPEQFAPREVAPPSPSAAEPSEDPLVPSEEGDAAPPEEATPAEPSPWLASPEGEAHPPGEPHVGESVWRVRGDDADADSGDAGSEAGPLGSVPGEEQDLNEEDKLRRQRLLRRSFDSLGSLPKSGSPEGGTRSAPAGAADPSTAAGGAAPAEARGPQSPEDQVLAARIESRAASIGKEDLYVRLGLPRGVGKEQVKSAYLGAVMVFHPDRLPQTLGYLSPKMQFIFAAINEAHDVLSDEVRRATYLRQLESAASGAPPKGRSEEVEVLERQADVALRKKEFTRAAELFGRAFAISKNAAHLAQEAWSIYLDPEQKSNLAGVKRMLEQALKMDNACDRAAYSLGVIARVEGDLDKAEKLFRAALHSNPRNAEAATELRLIEMRRKKPGKKGLFG